MENDFNDDEYDDYVNDIDLCEVYDYCAGCRDDEGNIDSEWTGI